MRSDEVLKPDIFSELILTVVGLAIGWPFSTADIPSASTDGSTLIFSTAIMRS